MNPWTPSPQEQYILRVIRLLQVWGDDDFRRFLWRHQTLVSAWQASRSGAWMLWLAQEHNGPRQPMVLAAAGCADLALARVKQGPLHVAVETARQWAYGNVTEADVAAAHEAADEVYHRACQANFRGLRIRSELQLEVAGTAACTTARFALGQHVSACHRTVRAFGSAACADVVRRYYPVAPELHGVGRLVQAEGAYVGRL